MITKLFLNADKESLSILFCCLFFSVISLFQTTDPFAAEISVSIKANLDDFSAEDIVANALVFSQDGQQKNEKTEGDGELLDDEIVFESLNVGVPFTPTFGFKNVPRPDDTRFVRSTTLPALPARAEAKLEPPSLNGDPEQSSFIISGKAETLVDQGLTFAGFEPFQWAGHEADWPGLVSPGTFDYSPLIRELTLVVNSSSSVNEFAGVEIFGEKATIPAADEEAVFTPVWTLTVSADRFLNDPSDLIIEFVIEDSMLTLTENDVEKRLRDAFDIENGRAILENDFVLFDSEYKVNQNMLFGEGIRGAAISVPEPSSISLGVLGVGIAGMRSIFARKRKKI